MIGDTFNKIIPSMINAYHIFLYYIHIFFKYLVRTKEL